MIPDYVLMLLLITPFAAVFLIAVVITIKKLIPEVIKELKAQAHKEG